MTLSSIAKDTDGIALVAVDGVADPTAEFELVVAENVKAFDPEVVEVVDDCDCCSVLIEVEEVDEEDVEGLAPKLNCTVGVDVLVERIVGTLAIILLLLLLLLLPVVALLTFLSNDGKVTFDGRVD